MVSCCAFGCTNRTDNHKPGITFHKFPIKPERRAQWIKAVRRENWKPSCHTKICSVHFTEEDFNRTLARIRLKDSAVPSKFEAFPRYLQKKQSHRKPSSYFASTSGLSREEHPVLSRQGCSSDTLNTEASNVTEVPFTSVLPVTVSTELELSSNTMQPIAEKDVRDPLTQHISPSKDYYKWKCKQLEEKCKKLERKVKTLQAANRRKTKKIYSLNELFAAIGKNHLLNEDDLVKLTRASSSSKNLLTDLFGEKSKRFSDSVKTFALNLHYYSPRAYNFVRESFDTCLPHEKTISKWYKAINCEPGFTTEALNCLKEKSTSIPKPKCSLVIDEISIRRHPCFDGKVCHGFISFGGNDDSGLAKEVLVFMVVCINYNWKIPVGYFLLDGITSFQKKNLVEQCLSLLYKVDIDVVSLTFDGLSANICMAEHLGCNFSDFRNFKTSFKHPESENLLVSVFLDPCHMIKLLRNCLGEKKIIFDGENKKIRWQYLIELNDVQTQNGLHLGNKLRVSHINWQKQKMKVPLAAQIFSDSVADAIEHCDKKLKMKRFEGSEGTVKFIRIVNKLFDILNSRSLKQLPHKRAIDKDNMNLSIAFLQYADLYLEGLKIKDKNDNIVPILSTKRRTGFLGLKICISSLINLLAMVKNQELLYMPTYKLSQDHLELFFSNIRCMGGANNNPTAQQFKAAYRKLLIHTELRDCKNGNCLPQGQVSILNCANSGTSLQIINESSNRSRMLDDDNDYIITEFLDLPDHTYAFNPGHLSEFANECIEYISGSIVRRLRKQLKCEVCLNALFGEFQADSITAKKSKGYLFFPSNDVKEICKKCESIFRLTVLTQGQKHLNKKLNVIKFANETLKAFVNKNVFDSLFNHIRDMGPMENHRTHLIREIAYCYYQARIGHFTKQQIDAPSIRSFYTKLIIFKGQ